MHAQVKEILLLTTITLGLATSEVQAQDSTITARPLVRAYIDCSQCDEDYLREQIGFVNLVRDPRLADVTVQVTSLPNASGGRTFSIEVIGMKKQVRSADTILVDVNINTPQIEGRDMLVRGVKVGLVPYLIGSSALPHLDVAYSPPKLTEMSATRGVHDKWNQWVFRLSGQGSIDGDDNYSNRAGNGEVRATRVTEQLKLSFNAKGELSRARYKLSDSSTLVSNTHNWQARALAVQSVGPNLSLGFRVESGSSVFEKT